MRHCCLLVTIALLLVLPRPAVGDTPLPPADQQPVYIREFKIQFIDGKEYPKLRSVIQNLLPPVDPAYPMEAFHSRDKLHEILSNCRAMLAKQGYPNVTFQVDPVVKGGKVLLHVGPGYVSAVHPQPDNCPRLDPEYIRNRIEWVGGRPLKLQALQSEITWMARSPLFDPGYAFNATLVPDVHPPPPNGEVDKEFDAVWVDLQYREARPWDFELSFNNHRPPSVGAEAFETYVANHNLTHRGDDLAIRYAITTGGLSDMRLAGVDDVSVAYTLPITVADTNIRVAYARTNVPQVDQPLADLAIRSRNQDASITLAQPFYLSTELKVGLNVGFDFRNDHTTLSGSPVNFIPSLADGASQVTAVQTGQSVDYVGDQGQLSARSTFNIGLSLPGSTSLPRPAADGQFLSWDASINYRRPRLFNSNVDLVSRFSTQLSNDHLLAIEQYSLGGFDTVRGYREQELLRDNGMSASVELQWSALGEYKTDWIIKLAPFGDVGYAWDHGESSHQPLLAALGVGLIIARKNCFQGELYWGHPFQTFHFDHPNLQDDGLHFDLTFFPNG